MKHTEFTERTISIAGIDVAVSETGDNHNNPLIALRCDSYEALERANAHLAAHSSISVEDIYAFPDGDIVSEETEGTKYYDFLSVLPDMNEYALNPVSQARVYSADEIDSAIAGFNAQ